MTISGVNKVLNNLNKEVLGMRNRSRAGMRTVGFMVKATSLSLTPVDTGNLRGGAYMRSYDTPDGPGAEIGYTAAYAVFVHERTELHHKSPTQSKFLEEALKRDEKRILEIIRKTAKV